MEGCIKYKEKKENDFILDKYLVPFKKVTLGLLDDLTAIGDYTWREIKEDTMKTPEAELPKFTWFVSKSKTCLILLFILEYIAST